MHGCGTAFAESGNNPDRVPGLGVIGRGAGRAPGDVAGHNPVTFRFSGGVPAG